MTVSFLEIYNEKIYDLLNSAAFRLGAKQKVSPLIIDPLGGLKLRWRDDQDCYEVENLFAFEVTTYD